MFVLSRIRPLFDDAFFKGVFFFLTLILPSVTIVILEGIFCLQS